MKRYDFVDVQEKLDKNNSDTTKTTILYKINNVTICTQTINYLLGGTGEPLAYTKNDLSWNYDLLKLCFPNDSEKELKEDFNSYTDSLDGVNKEFIRKLLWDYFLYSITRKQLFFDTLLNDQKVYDFLMSNLRLTNKYVEFTFMRTFNYETDKEKIVKAILINWNFFLYFFDYSYSQSVKIMEDFIKNKPDFVKTVVENKLELC